VEIKAWRVVALGFGRLATPRRYMTTDDSGYSGAYLNSGNAFSDSLVASGSRNCLSTT
jgi:hypothetical protein